MFTNKHLILHLICGMTSNILIPHIDDDIEEEENERTHKTRTKT